MATDNDVFYANNKKTTDEYCRALALAISSTGTIPVITQMAFGDGGEVDEQGNPATPSPTGGLQNQLIVKDIKSVTYPTDRTVRFEAEIEAGELTASINEAALICNDGSVAGKVRLLTPKGVDNEAGIVFWWTVEF